MSGKVFFQEDADEAPEAVEGATINIYSTDSFPSNADLMNQYKSLFTSITNKAGKYRIEGIEAGKYVALVRVADDGMMVSSFQTISVNRDKRIHQDFTVKE